MNKNNCLYNYFDYKIRECPHCHKVINEFCVAFPYDESDIKSNPIMPITFTKDFNGTIDCALKPIYLCPECCASDFVLNQDEAYLFLNLPTK